MLGNHSDTLSTGDTNRMSLFFRFDIIIIIKSLFQAMPIKVRYITKQHRNNETGLNNNTSNYVCVGYLL